MALNEINQSIRLLFGQIRRFPFVAANQTGTLLLFNESQSIKSVLHLQGFLNTVVYLELSVLYICSNLCIVETVFRQSARCVTQTAAEPETREEKHEAVNPTFVNRNPRNLEQMALAVKDRGWATTWPHREFYHRCVCVLLYCEWVSLYCVVVFKLLASQSILWWQLLVCEDLLLFFGVISLLCDLNIYFISVKSGVLMLLPLLVYLYLAVSHFFRLVFSRSQHHVTAQVFSSGSPVPVLSCSTKEWALKKELASTHCVAACQAVGEVLAHRCMQAGITRMVYRAIPWTYRSDAVSAWTTICIHRLFLTSSHAACLSYSDCFSLPQVQSFRAAMKDGGITLSEPRRKYIDTWIEVSSL